MTITNQSLNFIAVDDDSFHLKLIQGQLKNLGHACHLFSDSSNALSYLENSSHNNTIVILDLNMPGINGVEFMSMVKAIGYCGGIILCSGEDTRLLESCTRLAAEYQLGVLGFIQKPVDPGSLEKFINRFDPGRSPGPAETVPATHIDRESLVEAITFNELTNHYQPIIDLRTGKPVAVEALVRWNHPVYGQLLPGAFISLVEEYQLIDGLFRNVLSRALKDWQAWTLQGISLNLSVNASMDNLAYANLSGFVDRSLLNAGFNPENLVLEVTESRFMRNYCHILSVLASFRLKRINIAIDDFGTGHSSLSQLRDIPFSFLKIDRSFTRGVARDPTLQAIVEGNLKIARGLGLHVTAEGVENEADMTYLVSNHCDFAQGNHFGPPIPADQIPCWYFEWCGRNPAT